MIKRLPSITNKRNKPKKAIRSKVVWTYLLIAVILICCYLGIYHTHHYYDYLPIVIIITGMLCISTLQTMWFAARNQKWEKFRSFLGILFVACPIAFGVHKLQQRYCQQQLSDHGIIALAKVTELFQRTHKRKVTHYAKFEYHVNGKTWSQKLVNKNFRIALNDSLKIRCSSEEPEIFEVVAIKKALDN